MARPKGGYRLKDGTKVPGVTTIIGRFKDSGALMWWAFSQGQAAERGEISSLYDKRDQAADAGTLAHSLVEAHIYGYEQPDIPDDEIGKLARQGFESYLKWSEGNNIRIIEQEIELVSENHKFAGCVDAIGVNDDDQLCVLDWKTSNGVYPDYVIQIAAYGQLWNENNPKTPITGGYHLCRFSKDKADFAHHFWTELDDAWEQFKLFRKAYDLDKIIKKRV